MSKNIAGFFLVCLLSVAPVALADTNDMPLITDYERQLMKDYDLDTEKVYRSLPGFTGMIVRNMITPQEAEKKLVQQGNKHSTIFRFNYLVDEYAIYTGRILNTMVNIAVLQDDNQYYMRGGYLKKGYYKILGTEMMENGFGNKFPVIVYGELK